VSETERTTAQVTAWIEANLGPVIAIERQARWRPAWFVEVQREDGVLPLYVRGAREGARNIYPIDQEAEVLRILEAHGIPVPHVYGMIDRPWAIVMDKLPGQANLANVEDDEERRAILGEYMDILAQVHAIDPKEFLPAGFSMPADRATHALSWFNGVEERYRRTKKRPEPLLEFVVKWVRRQVPEHGWDTRFILGDPGQFMFQDGRITGLLDFEFGHLGDVAHDLASMRLRDIPEPLGDVGGGLLRYEAKSGKPLDLALIDFHTVKWVICTPLSLIATLHDPPQTPDLMQYVEWFHQYSLTASEGIANIIGVTLLDLGLPEPSPSRHGWVHDAFPTIIRSLEGGDGHGGVPAAGRCLRSRGGGGEPRRHPGAAGRTPGRLASGGRRPRDLCAGGGTGPRRRPRAHLPSPGDAPDAPPGARSLSDQDHPPARSPTRDHRPSLTP